MCPLTPGVAAICSYSEFARAARRCSSGFDWTTSDAPGDGGHLRDRHHRPRPKLTCYCRVFQASSPRTKSAVATSMDWSIPIAVTSSFSCCSPALCCWWISHHHVHGGDSLDLLVCCLATTRLGEVAPAARQDNFEVAVRMGCAARAGHSEARQHRLVGVESSLLWRRWMLPSLVVAAVAGCRRRCRCDVAERLSPLAAVSSSSLDDGGVCACGACHHDAAVVPGG